MAIFTQKRKKLGGKVVDHNDDSNDKENEEQACVKRKRVEKPNEEVPAPKNQRLKYKWKLKIQLRMKRNNKCSKNLSKAKKL